MIREPLARQLFTSSQPTTNRLRRRALRKKTEQPPHIIGLIAFSFVLLSAILLPVVLNDSHYDLKNGLINLINEDLPLFLSDYPMNNSTLPDWADYRGELIMGVANALSFSVISGIFLSLLTYFCVYYNSAVPGICPQSPISPRPPPHPRNPRRGGQEEYAGSIAISYKMVPVNGVVFGLATLIFLRLYLNVPF